MQYECSLVFTMQFFMSMGVISLAQLAVLQVAFSVTILLLDFPCAILSDRYRRKYSVMAGDIMTGAFYLLCLQAPNITILIIAEILYAARNLPHCKCHRRMDLSFTWQ